MKPSDPSNNRLTRRAWMVLTGSTLSACGGGGGGSLFASPGTGGTGSPVYSQGSIAGFGSVIVNGIKFDDVNARVVVDGLVGTSADLRLGMVAEIQGERGADLTLGTARSIEVWTIAQGAVSQPSTSGFVVSGMTIVTNNNTVFDGVSATSQLQSGQTVAVWGLQAGADGTRWTATRVALLPAATQMVSTGFVSMSHTQRYVNDLALTGSGVDALVIGALVRVQGVLSADGSSVAVTSTQSFSQGAIYQAQGEVEIEGYVTSIVSPTRCTMGNIDVDGGSAVYAGGNIYVGARVEIYGSWEGKILKATKIELEDEQTLHQAEISGTITTFVSVANFVVRSERCDASTASFSNGKAADLKAGVKVKVKGTKAGDVLMVTSVEFDD
jgi:hypothetical protein